MARRLGSFNFPVGTVWSDRYQVNSVAQSSKFSTSGDAVFWMQTKRGGRPITLEFPENAAWLTEGQVKTLLLLSINPSVQHVFEWDDERVMVYFDHARGATEFIQVVGYENPTDDYFHGKINLITAN